MFMRLDGNRKPRALLMGTDDGAAPGKTGQNSRVRITPDLAIALRDTRPERWKASDVYTPTPIAALFTKLKRWKQPQCPLTGERIKKMWCVRTYSEMSFNLTRRALLGRGTACEP